jgi:hypothetical protein
MLDSAHIFELQESVNGRSYNSPLLDLIIVLAYLTAVAVSGVRNAFPFDSFALHTRATAGIFPGVLHLPKPLLTTSPLRAKASVNEVISRSARRTYERGQRFLAFLILQRLFACLGNRDPVAL